MPDKVRVATFNVENLFDRARVLNLDGPADSTKWLDKIRDFEVALGKAQYDPPKLFQMYKEVATYIDVVEVRGKLFKYIGNARTGVQAAGRGAWEGWIEFRRADFNEEASENTARVIREIDPQVLCLIEVESRPVLEKFASLKFKDKRKYRHAMLIDGNDPRGIDVGLLSRYELGRLRSHIDDRNAEGTPIFSRDCLEVEVKLSKSKSLFLLLNHFKSKHGGDTPEDRARRQLQADTVKDVLRQNYDLKKDLVVVAGDFNDTPDSPALAGLLAVPRLHDVLKLKVPNAAQRWTYHYQRFDQIDYLLVSEPLKAALKDAGVFRRGIFEVDKLTNGAEKPLPTVTSRLNGASDHGLVWADFAL